MRQNCNYNFLFLFLKIICRSLHIIFRSKPTLSTLFKTVFTYIYFPNLWYPRDRIFTQGLSGRCRCAEFVRNCSGGRAESLSVTDVTVESRAVGVLQPAGTPWQSGQRLHLTSSGTTQHYSQAPANIVVRHQPTL